MMRLMFKFIRDSIVHKTPNTVPHNGDTVILLQATHVSVIGGTPPAFDAQVIRLSDCRGMRYVVS